MTDGRPASIYNDLIDRNLGFLTTHEQVQIKTANILVAGCGLGSNVAVLAARTGFTGFILADGDKVEINNLNRQAFRINQVGKNKAEATAQLIKEINPEVRLEIFPRFINEKEVDSLVSKADIILNTIDPSPAIFVMDEVARRQKKLVLFPMNIGFGGVTLAFAPDSVSVEEMAGGTFTDMSLFMRLLEKAATYAPYIQDYFNKHAELLSDVLKGTQPGPQLGVASNINASLIVTAMVRERLGLPIKKAPEPLALDASIIHPVSKEGEQ